MSENDDIRAENTENDATEEDFSDPATEIEYETSEGDNSSEPADDGRIITVDDESSGSPAQNAQNETPNQNETADEDAAEEKAPVKKTLKVPLFIAVISVLAAAVLASQITFLAVRQSYHKKLATIEKERFADSKLSEVDKIYRSYYINEIDDEALVDGLIQGYMFGAGDQYASYMSPEDYAEYINSLNSESKGIGASVIWNSEMAAIEVIYVYEGSPAEEAGVLIGDLIIEVDGKDVSELGYEAGVSAVKGEVGTKAKLTILRGENYEQTVQIESERREITARTVSFTAYGEVAVIHISNFHATTPAEFKAAVAQATSAGCNRIVFDLRNNTGGLLTSVAAVLDYILPEGVIVRWVDAQGNWDEYKSDASCLQMPMVVIVNGYTASAAELFTSALMDYEYADVIGTQTYGKGTITSPFMLSDGSVIYVSVQHYYPPKSDNFEGVGITPDEIVELNDEAKKISYYKLTYETDNQLQRAVEIIKEK